jgi:DNA-binding MarR family transcriptional regulator
MPTQLTPWGEAFTELALEVFRLNGLLLEAGDELTRPVGQTSARWQVLGVVEHGPVTVPQVARVMGLTRQGVQRTADLLEEDGLIEYVENPHHRRAKLMRLTPEGRRTLDYIVERQAEWANTIGGQHDLGDLQKAVRVLRELKKSLESDTLQSSEESK